MPTPDERVESALRFAYRELLDAINELQFTVSLATRLRTTEPDAQARTEYLVASLAMLYEVRDHLENALPVAAVADDEGADDGSD